LGYARRSTRKNAGVSDAGGGVAVAKMAIFQEGAFGNQRNMH
jgi:hypothetical protein